MDLHLTDSDDCALSAGFGFWFSSLTWLWAGQLAIGIVCFPSTARLLRPCRDFQMSNMTDTRKRFSSEAVSADGGEVFESL